MHKEEVLFIISKLDLLYNRLHILDESLHNKQITELEYLKQELVIKQKIEKIFEC